jgi:hypothetical protein
MKKFANWLYRLTHRSEIQLYLRHIEMCVVSSTSGVPDLKKDYQIRLDTFVQAGTMLKILRPPYARSKKR